MKIIHQIAEENSMEVKRKSKITYDKGAKLIEFNQGDKVLVLHPFKENKLQAKYMGPYEVIKHISEVDYLISTLGKMKEQHICHVNHLKPFMERVACLVKGLDDTECVKMPEREDEVDYLLDLSSGNSGVKDIKLPSSLDKDQQMLWTQMLYKHHELFSDEPGLTTLMNHNIQLTSNQSVVSRPYQTPYHLKEVMEKEIDELLRLKVIKPLPIGGDGLMYLLPALLVTKPTGGYHMCIDYQKINQITEKRIHILYCISCKC